MEISNHTCIITINEEGTPLLISSSPSLLENNIFDGIFLEDNINNQKDIPKELGIYQCNIKVSYYKSYTDCVYEYDMDLYIENIQKIELEFPTSPKEEEN